MCRITLTVPGPRAQAMPAVDGKDTGQSANRAAGNPIVGYH
jgi:hypothetical protein